MNKWVLNVYEINCPLKITFKGIPYSIPRDGKLYEIPEELANCLAGSHMVKIFHNFKPQVFPPKAVETNVVITEKKEQVLVVGDKFPEIDISHSVVTPDEYGVHYRHCNQGDYIDGCKYGNQETCPALKKTQEELREINNGYLNPGEDNQEVTKEETIAGLKYDVEQMEQQEKEREESERIREESNAVYSNGRKKKDTTGALKKIRLSKEQRKNIKSKRKVNNPAAGRQKSFENHLSNLEKELNDLENTQSKLNEE